MTWPALSVVIPFLDEADAIPCLLAEVTAALDGTPFEIVAVNDGSTDRTPQILADIARGDPRLRVLTHPRRAGQSTAIRTGVRAARHPWIVTLDGDGQNPPDQIPHLVAALLAADQAGVGMVQGERAVRRDGLSKRIGSRVANGIRGALLKDRIGDSGCGLRLFRRDAYLELPFFDHLHRFMPAMMLREGWAVRTAPVSHRPRATGRSKYGNLQRALVGIIDLAGAAWLIRRRSPLCDRPAPEIAARGAADLPVPQPSPSL